MLYRKPAQYKYTDLCIFIDNNVKLIQEPGKYPEIEDTIFNYLWLILKAIAIKRRMFTKFDDYDGYAFYGARRIFFALRKNLINQGKIVKGREIQPIRSCLNYIKALLYPMKVEYQREAYADDMYMELLNDKFDAMAMTEHLRSEAMTAAGCDEQYRKQIRELFMNLDTLIEEVLTGGPFSKGTLDYKHLKISILLNCLSNLRNEKTLDFEAPTTIVWKLPKSTAAYIRVMQKQLAIRLKENIMSEYSSTRIDERLLDYMMANPNGGTTTYGED